MLTPTTTAIIAIGALVVFGPKKLPELARSLGRSLSEFKAGAEEAQATFKRELDHASQAPKPATPEALEPKPEAIEPKTEPPTA